MAGILEGVPLGVKGGTPLVSWGSSLPLLHFPNENEVLPFPEPTSLDPCRIPVTWGGFAAAPG